MFFTRPAGDRYVDRGNVSAYDYTQSDLTMDSQYHDLDLSNIVQKGSTYVRLNIFIMHSIPGLIIYFRKKGHTSDYPAIKRGIQNTSVGVFDTIKVGLDANAVIQYKVYPMAFDSLDITILGWWV